MEDGLSEWYKLPSLESFSQAIKIFEVCELTPDDRAAE